MVDLATLEKLPATPMWAQYASIKKDALDSLLFYRMGDFYELFLDDAVEAAGILGITLTARNKGEEMPIPMCGVPFHSATNYINRLLQAGRRVAICEQTEEAGATKGIVKREIVRIVSPGIAYDQDSLDGGSNNYLLCLHLNEESSLRGSYCALDISTGSLFFSPFQSIDDLRDELAVLQPKEIIAPQGQIGSALWNELVQLCGKEYFSCVSATPDFYFSPESSYTLLCTHYNLLNLEAFGLHKSDAVTGAVGAAVRKAKDTQKLGTLQHLQAPKLRIKSGYLQLDESTIEHLDIFPKPGQSPQDSLFFHLNRTATAMGARKLKELLARPLAQKAAIEERQEAIEELCKNYSLQQKVQQALQGMRDIERLTSKLGLRSASPRDLEALKDIFARLPLLKESLQKQAKTPLLLNMEKRIGAFSDLFQYLDTRLKEELPAISREGNIFKSGWHSELDELIILSEDGKSILTQMEQRERDATGISSLKIKYNKVFGYFIEITNSNLDAVPAHYIRKQTTANGERFLTDELKKFEDKILRAEEKRIRLEESLFEEAIAYIGQQSQSLLATAQELALLDALLSLALAAVEHRYQRPELTTDLVLHIQDGRHPALENVVGKTSFIANDSSFSEKQRLFLLTGPNMAGKSTYMRQVALITLMAHVGSFVPAKKALIGITDRIATRVGASDRIGRGQSTFMVEMNEMARILRQSTERSLLIIDEIGRGTSTFDGLALAWSILEDIQARLSCRTLFATHYHELTLLEEKLSGIKNLSVAVEQRGNGIVFLHKVIEGKASGSLGVEVAQLAGLPEDIVSRARIILDDLEKGSGRLQKAQRDTLLKGQQLSFFAAAQNASSPTQHSTPKLEPKPEIPEHLLLLEKELSGLNLDQTTPLNALLALKNWKERLPGRTSLKQ